MLNTKRFSLYGLILCFAFVIVMGCGGSENSGDDSDEYFTDDELIDLAFGEDESTGEDELTSNNEYTAPGDRVEYGVTIVNMTDDSLCDFEYAWSVGNYDNKEDYGGWRRADTRCIMPVDADENGLLVIFETPGDIGIATTNHIASDACLLWLRVSSRVYDIDTFEETETFPAGTQFFTWVVGG